MKICSKCRIEKPHSEYHKKNTTKDGMSGHCKECQRAYVKSHYDRNRQYYLDKARVWEKENNVRKSGLTQEKYDQLFGEYEGLCWLCRSEPATVVDHDHECHETQKCLKCIRGALCGSCNWGLGNFKDSPELLARAIEYLTRSSVYPLATNESEG
jgi:Recombination endonuclease VII